MIDRETREACVKAVQTHRADRRDPVDAVLSTLTERGFSIVKLVEAGAVTPDGSGYRALTDNWTPEGWHRLFRIVDVPEGDT